MKLLTFNNAKTVKGNKAGWRTAIMYLAPSDASGVINTCKFATRECRRLCLYNSGHSLVFKSINAARVKRTVFLSEQRDKFLEQLKREIKNHIATSKKHRLKPCVRLNGTSDIFDKHFQSVIDTFHETQFYDYTKDYRRMESFMHQKRRRNGFPERYHLTFSHSEGRLDSSLSVLEQGYNVAVVFACKREEELPLTWKGYKVLDGDINDLRFLDPHLDNNERGFVIGLRSKGHATKAESKLGAFINPNQNT